MPDGPAKPEPFLNMLVARQLDRMTTGNNAYLMVLLRAARRAGLKVRLIPAPRRSFCNRPWMSIHPDFAATASEILFPQSVHFGGRYWSLSPVVWGRFVARLGQEALRRTGLRLGVVTRVTSTLGDGTSIRMCLPLEAA